MRRSPVKVIVSDHAVLRYMEREFGVDVEAIRRGIASLARNGAELRAIGIQTGRVKLVCRVRPDDGGPATVVVVTALYRQDTIRRA